MLKLAVCSSSAVFPSGSQRSESPTSWEEIDFLLQKQAISVVPPHDTESKTAKTTQRMASSGHYLATTFTILRWACIAMWVSQISCSIGLKTPASMLPTPPPLPLVPLGRRRLLMMVTIWCWSSCYRLPQLAAYCAYISLARICLGDYHLSGSCWTIAVP